MGELQERGEKIDRVTVANELMKFNELEACDGLSYLVSLDDGLPQLPNLDSYIRIVKDKSILRRIIFASQNMMSRCLMGEEEPDEILAGAEETLLKLGDTRVKSGLENANDIVTGYEGGINAFLDPSKRIKGISTGFAQVRRSVRRDARRGNCSSWPDRPSMGKTALALKHRAARGAQAETRRWAIFSLGNVQGVAADRLLCAAARVDSQKFARAISTRRSGRKLHHRADRTGGSAALCRRHAGASTDGHSPPSLRRLQVERHHIGLVIVD